MFDGIDPAIPAHPQWAMARNTVLLMAVAYQSAMATAMVLVLWRDWPWYEGVLAGFGVLWSIPIGYGAWVAGKALEDDTGPHVQSH